MGEQQGQQWLGAGIGAGAGALSMLGQKQREKRAMQNQEKLMGIQFGNQSALNDQRS